MQQWKNSPEINNAMIYLYGASGHGKVIADIVTAQGDIIGGFIDADTSKKVWQYHTYATLPTQFTTDDAIIISIGSNSIRKRLAAELAAYRFSKAIHPNAVVSSHSSIGVGTVIMAHVSVNADATVGNHCILNTNCSIDHDCVLENFVHISPNATLCGNVYVGEGTHVGAGAVIIQGKRIGKNVTIGAGSVVIRDVPDNAVVVGNPAKQIR